MENVDAISAHDQEAAQYDQQVRDYNSYVHDALFGMSFEYVNPHDCLLDIGIGTGLASQAFAKVGLEVSGCDGSTEMLKVCESKAFAKDLKVFDFHHQVKNRTTPAMSETMKKILVCIHLEGVGIITLVYGAFTVQLMMVSSL